MEIETGYLERLAVRSVIFLFIFSAVGGGFVLAGHSPDEPPSETALDPGDLFFSGGGLEVDDSCPALPGPPCLGVPLPNGFDLDAYSLETPVTVCPPFPNFDSGIVFSFDDGDPGAGSGPPNHKTEILLYDRCMMFGGGSFLTNVTESFLGLGADPPPPSADDDVDAYETRGTAPEWNAGGLLLFSPDTPSSGGLTTDPLCPGSLAAGDLYSNSNGGSVALYASPCSLGVPDPEFCDIDALTTVTGEEAFPAAQIQILFSTDAEQPCGLDPGDIYISDNAGNSVLWADDVLDLKIANGEDEPVDLDALSVNINDTIFHGDPYVPPLPFRWKADWPDYAPSGMPDFNQYHAAFPGGGSTYCGPTAAADCLWWFDSEMEGRCGGGPGDGADDYSLLEAYAGVPDDHQPENVRPFVEDLASWVKTDVAGAGTRIADMEIGLRNYIDFHGKSSAFTVKKITNPAFEQIACEVEHSHDVILLLGFWWTENGIDFFRCGGHFVTSAGSFIQRDAGPDGCPGACGFDDDGDGLIDEPDEMCPCNGDRLENFGSDDVCDAFAGQIAVSDTGLDNAEVGGAGRVRGPDHTDHAPAVTPPPSHDDPENVSHDEYGIIPAGPGIPFLQELSSYGGGPNCDTVIGWCEQNPDEEGNAMLPCTPASVVHVAVEGMIDIEPVATPVCLNVQAGMSQMVLAKGACPSPASNPFTLDYIAGELCQVSEPGSVDLGIVNCLVSDTPVDQQLDRSTWDATDGIGAWFYLVRKDPATDYGLSSGGNPRFPSAGDCP